MSSPKFLSRGIDYLGDLGAKLRDLQGYRTLAHELVQNADDAPEATTMAFDVRTDGLIVDNDGIFSDCGNIEGSECLWKSDPSRGHKCDFHRFRQIAAGDKRLELHTTGAFGIGFIAVYQITDRPELISGGRHWILHEDRDEQERIEVCPGCGKCRTTDLPGTRFILPWARDPESLLRKALRAESVHPAATDRMLQELKQSLPVAMLFLKHLRTIEIRHEGQQTLSFKRMDDGQHLLLTDGHPENDRIWYLVKGEFERAAQELRHQHGGRIEAKRSHVVGLAIPTTGELSGVLCACLPTEQNPGLPFHLNADFFPTNDRKGIILGSDYQSNWNLEAIRAGARAFAAAIGTLAGQMGAKRLWHILTRLEELARKSQQDGQEKSFASFWNEAAQRIPSLPIVADANGHWMGVTDGSLLLQVAEAPAIPVLTSLGLRIVSEELRPFQSLLRSAAVGVPVLDATKLSWGLISSGLDRHIPKAALPSWLASRAAKQALWGEVATLLDRPSSKSGGPSGKDQLRRTAIAPGLDGGLWPCNQIYEADPTTIEQFERLRLGVSFLAQDDAFRDLTHLCASFDAAAAVNALEGADASELQQVCQNDRALLSSLLRWFEARAAEIVGKAQLQARFTALPIFPSADCLVPLSELALPGDFHDPLGLTDLADLSALDGRRDFLRDLGVRELDFPTYVTIHLPRGLCAEGVAASKRREAVLLLASNLSRLKDASVSATALRDVPLVECTDGVFRTAAECHFDSPIVRLCLGEDAHLIQLPEGRHKATVAELYRWLGVGDMPRLDDIVEGVQAIVEGPFNNSAAEKIKEIVAHLGQRIDAKTSVPALAPLKSLRWLPARNREDRWYAPTELYATYQAYLFESQAIFVDLPQPIQNASRALLELLGVHITPSTSMVVKHLLRSAEQGVPAHADIYRYLNDRAAESAISFLRGRKSLWFSGAYRSADQVFWSDHSFGRYRWQLSEGLKSFGNLLEALGVRQTPTWRDAIAVLREIADEYGAQNRLLDDDTQSVLFACWRILGRAIDEEDDEAICEIRTLRSVKCVPTAKSGLNPPEWMFFENRAGQAAKFGHFLDSNITPRVSGTGQALHEAGVRALGSAVQIELLECTDTAEDEEVASRVKERSAQIARVLEMQGDGYGGTAALDTLMSIQWQTASTIRIRYRLEAFNKDLRSEPETVPAIYFPEARSLTYTRGSRLPLPAIARELAVALLPDMDPGQFAPGIKEVIAAATRDEARASLDELGIAPLATETGSAAPQGGATATTLGTDLGPGAGEPLRTATPDGTGSNGVSTVDGAIRSLLGPDGAPPTKAPPIEGGDEGSNGGGGRRGGKPKPGANKTSRPVLRSYVATTVAPTGSRTTGESSGDSDGPEPRSPVDIAGVRRVLQFEADAGRRATEMPHKNPGYDIQSCDQDGKVVRYIEVKSLSGAWRSTYAVLSRPQFQKALSLGDGFWLYVVERATSDNFRIYPIQNPATRANHFMFDDGWSATAEEPTSISTEG